MNLVNAVLGPVLSIIDKAVPNRAEADRLKAEITQTVLANEAEMLKAATEIAANDSKSEGWLTRNARPLVVINMLVFLNLFIVTMLINPDLALRMAEAMTQVPNMVWALIGGGIGVYPILRGIGKVKGTAGK